MDTEQATQPVSSRRRTKPRVLSGIQPTGVIHLGNYIGAVKQWVGSQSEKENFFCIVDLHSLTIYQDPNDLRERTRSLAAVLLAAGIDPNKSSLFIQSHVSAHAEAGWLLNCVTPLGWLYKMTQFKDKSSKLSGEMLEGYRKQAEAVSRNIRSAGEALSNSLDGFFHELAKLPQEQSFKQFIRIVELSKSKRVLSSEEFAQARRDHEEILKLAQTLGDDVFDDGKLDAAINQDSISTGLLDYPVLMAADILLYDTDEVPVGEDQKQHVELTRNVAQRFNRIYGETFAIPRPVIPKVGARIMGLDNPLAKMSKSTAVRGHAVGLLDDPAEIERTFKRAVTDTGNEIRFSDDPAKAGVNNLLSIYKVITGGTEEDVESDFRDARGYGDLKKRVAEVVIEELRPIRERHNELIGDPAELDRILAIGAEQARDVANRTLETMKDRMGLVGVQSR